MTNIIFERFYSKAHPKQEGEGYSDFACRYRKYKKSKVGQKVLKRREDKVRKRLKKEIAIDDMIEMGWLKDKGKSHGVV